MSSTIQNYLSQATNSLKEFLGMDTFPQSGISHDRAFLNDIAKGNWSTLRPTTVRITTRPVVGFPSNYSYPSSSRKLQTKSVRYPFLSQIRETNNLQRLRPTKTADRSLYVADKGYKSRLSNNRRQLLSEIQSFDRNSLSYVPEPSGPGLLSQARDALSTAYGNVKEALGMNSYPQSQTEHELQYLNDIAQGSWNLRKVRTRETTVPVVGFPAASTRGRSMHTGMRFNLNAPRRPMYLSQIRDRQWRLRHVEPLPSDLSARLRSNFPSWRMTKPTDRRQLLNSIRGFDRNSLKGTKPILPVGDLMEKARDYVSGTVDSVKETLGMNTYPQSSINHNVEYLNNIAKGDWNKLNHVEDVQERNAMIGNDWKLGKSMDRSALLEEVKEGCDLKHVQTVEKVQPIIEPGYKVKQGEERKMLMTDIREFDNISLHHMGAS